MWYDSAMMNCPHCPHPAHSEAEPPPDALYWNPDNSCGVLEDIGDDAWSCPCTGESVADEKLVPLFKKYILKYILA